MKSKTLSSPKKKTLSKQPIVQKFEITLEIETGNLIYRKFDNKEDVLKFLNEYTKNPKKVLEEISPKKRAKKIRE